MSSSAGASRPLRLEPPDRTAGPNSHYINMQASAWWSDPQTHEAREKLLHHLVWRKRRGTKDDPVRRTQGVLSADDVEQSKKARRAHVVAAIMRLMAWATLRSDWRSNDIGAFREGKIHYPTRIQIARGAGFEYLIDAGKRVRCWELDDRLDDAIAAGLLFRLVEEDSQGRPSVFRVRALAWQLAGVALKRALEKKKAAKTAAEAKRPPKPPKELDQAAAFVGSLARAADPHRDDYYASAAENPPEARGWRKKPPPT